MWQTHPGRLLLIDYPAVPTVLRQKVSLLGELESDDPSVRFLNVDHRAR